MSNRFFEKVIDEEEKVCCPTLTLPECAAALARRTNRTEMGAEIVRFIQTFPSIRLEPLTLRHSELAAEIAAHYRLRGADAIYVATAAQWEASLVTWDTEMLERGASVVDTVTPQEWLQQSRA
jgi:predicted nucleic acid-binding protein